MESWDAPEKQTARRQNISRVYITRKKKSIRPGAERPGNQRSGSAMTAEAESKDFWMGMGTRQDMNLTPGAESVAFRMRTAEKKVILTTTREILPVPETPMEESSPIAITAREKSARLLTSKGI